MTDNSDYWEAQFGSLYGHLPAVEAVARASIAWQHGRHSRFTERVLDVAVARLRKARSNGVHESSSEIGHG